MGWFDRPEFGTNLGLIDEMYHRYLDDPSSVSAAWQEFFEERSPTEDALSASGVAERTSQPETRTRPASLDTGSWQAIRIEPDGSLGAASSPVAVPPAATSTGNGHAQASTSSVGGTTVAQFSAETSAAPSAQGPAQTSDAPDAARRVNLTDPAAAQGEERVRLRGSAARLVEHMEESLEIPTATSVRVVPAKLLEVNRARMNGHLIREGAPTVSYTHLIAWALIRALRRSRACTRTYLRIDGKPWVSEPEHFGVGIAVDVARADKTRSLMVPVVKDADTLSFRQFVNTFERLRRAAAAGALRPEDLAGATVTVTNPGTVGTHSSVPRLPVGPAVILGVGAIAFPPEYAAADPATLAELGIGKVLTLTSTYDHRVIQGAESGALLGDIAEQLLGARGFYEDVFGAMGTFAVPTRWSTDHRPAAGSLEAAEKQSQVHRMINMYRVRGHLIANLDPLQDRPPHLHPELDPASFGLTVWDLDRRFLSRGLGGARELPLGEILELLRAAYCRTATVEYMHISQPEEKRWIQERMEVKPTPPPLSDQRRILRKLGEAEAFERFLHAKYVGHKRFSLEGAETLIPMLDVICDAAASARLDEVVIGMSHRGRLNVLANTIGKSYSEIFREFEATVDPDSAHGSGDVKYHLGEVGTYEARSGRELIVSVASNPSHLESVDPVVEGMVRAKQEILGRGAGASVLAMLVHGDAAFAGQGVVAETLNLSQLNGYRTGGTIHLVVNNQVGFTTTPDYGRSSTYATDVAKMIEAPIFHVNGDDPEACVRVARLAFAFRRAFKKDVVIDMWCYRRWGHNEADEPAFTQPLMYERIRNRRSVRKLYTEALVNRGDLTLAQAENALEEFRGRLQQAFEETREAIAHPPRPAPLPISHPEPLVRSAVELPVLKDILGAITVVPDNFTLHPKLVAWMADRARALDGGAVDWSLGEALALGSLVREGLRVRLSGQDTRRGTFSQRHAVVVDQHDGSLYTPLAALRGHGTIHIYDSLLSEFAAMGFEYGYSVANLDALVCWEAQFGDFANGAQTVLDEFIAAAEDKWGQTSSLVLLLPHGNEGQGPDHSSARLERFLQLAAHGNIRVAQPSTPAQYFHLLRLQALRARRKPLIVLTPKSLLRLPAARSHPSELTNGTFQPVLDDLGADPVVISRVLLCTGKAFYELDRRRLAHGLINTALVRVEQLYPFPSEALAAVLDRFPGTRDVIWVQEEPANQGAWRFVEARVREELGISLRSVHRQESPSPSSGSSAVFAADQQVLLTEALPVE